MLIKVAGLDPSLRNWGTSFGVYDTETKKVTIHTLGVINPELPTGKQVRQNSLDLESAKQLYVGSIQAIGGAQAIFVEVPIGSQSARAMAGYAVCCGVLGSMRANGISFFEVTPTEVKLAGFGKKTASKQEMIQWAMEKHPEAPWPMYRHKGANIVSEAKAEHMADAIGAIYAGLASNAFQQMLPFMRQTN